MKTPAEIARDTYWTLSDSLLPDSPTGDDYRRVMRLAIEADRAQRNLIECIAEALDDRGAKDAAQLVRDTDPDDDLWNNYVGPMLDSIEDDYTRMAREIKEATA